MPPGMTPSTASLLSSAPAMVADVTRPRDPATGLPTRESLLDDLACSAGRDRLLVLIAAGQADAVAYVLEADPTGAMLRHAGAAMDEVAVQLGGSAYAAGGQLFAFVVPGHMQPGELVAAVRGNLQAWAEPLADCSVYGEAHLPFEARTPEDILRLAASRMRDRRAWREQAAGRQARGVLLRVLEERGLVDGIDRSTVAAHAMAVGRRFKLGLTELDDLIRAAELQDVGKAFVPDAILHKQGRLTAEEWAVIKRHPLAGERLLAGSAALSRVAQLVRSAYERWDGSGYPDGLAGESIPMGSRIISVCVAFSAMTSARPYRSPMTPEEAIAQLRIASGGQFDPAVVDAFCLEIEPTISLPDFALL